MGTSAHQLVLQGVTVTVPVSSDVIGYNTIPQQTFTTPGGVPVTATQVNGQSLSPTLALIWYRTTLKAGAGTGCANAGSASGLVVDIPVYYDSTANTYTIKLDQVGTGIMGIQPVKLVSLNGNLPTTGTNANRLWFATQPPSAAVKSNCSLIYNYLPQTSVYNYAFNLPNATNNSWTAYPAPNLDPSKYLP